MNKWIWYIGPWLIPNNGVSQPSPKHWATAEGPLSGVHSLYSDALIKLRKYSPLSFAFEKSLEKSKGAHASYLPTISANAQIAGNQQYLLPNGKTQPFSSSGSLGLSLQYNLYSGGKDKRTMESTQLSIQESKSKIQEEESKLLSDLLSQLLDFSAMKNDLNELLWQEAQWQKLLEMAERKAAAGLMNKRDLLEAKVEFTRHSGRVSAAKEKVFLALTTLQRTFWIPPYPNEKDIEIGLKQLSDWLPSQHLNSLTPKEIFDNSPGKSQLDAKGQLAKIELENAQSKVWDPQVSLKWTSQVNQELTKTAGHQNAILQNSISLNLSTQLFSPQDISLSKQAAIDFLETSTRREEAMQNTENLYHNLLGQLREQEKDWEVAKNLVRLQEEIYQTNLELFNAGSIDVDRVMASKNKLQETRCDENRKHQTHLSTKLKTLIFFHFGVHTSSPTQWPGKIAL